VPTRIAVVATIAISLAATLTVVVVPGLHFALRNHDLHVTLVTAEALIALMAAALVLGRFLRLRQSCDLALTAALATLAGSSLAFGVIPGTLGSDATVFATWSAVAARIAGALLFVAAAFGPDVRLLRARRPALAALAGVAVTLAVIAVVVALFDHALPQGVEAGASPERSGRPELDAHPALVASHLVILGLSLVAAAGFTRRSSRSGDRLAHWIAVACVVAAASRLNYALYPSLFTDWVYTGDAFRLLFYLVILVAAASEIPPYWRGLAVAAAADERRRIARDLHDGLAQELASIRRNLYLAESDPRALDRVRASADRALVESRRAIASLSDARAVPAAQLLAEAAREVCDREGTRVALSLEQVALDPHQAEQLVLIAREAITNAARHGRADLIRVQLTGGARPRLVVTDDGVGFEPGAGAGGGFGLRAMRERAEGLGGRMDVHSREGGPTRVEVRL
jgi:signal transduction histidine kinase